MYPFKSAKDTSNIVFTVICGMYKWLFSFFSWIFVNFQEWICSKWGTSKVFWWQKILQFLNIRKDTRRRDIKILSVDQPWLLICNSAWKECNFYFRVLASILGKFSNVRRHVYVPYRVSTTPNFDYRCFRILFLGVTNHRISVIK